MSLNKKRKKLLLILVFLMLFSFLMGSILAIKKVKKADKYMGLAAKANHEMNSGNYREAKELFNECLKIGKNDSIASKIDEINNIELSLDILSSANKLYDNGEYKKALEKLDSINNNSSLIEDKIYLLRIKILKKLNNLPETTSNNK